MEGDVLRCDANAGEEPMGVRARPLQRHQTVHAAFLESVAIWRQDRPQATLDGLELLVLPGHTTPPTATRSTSSANCILWSRAYSPGVASSSSCVPISTSQPSSRTAIRSAARIVERR